MLLSRAESLDLAGSRILQGWDTHVLQPLAEVEPGDDIGEPVPSRGETDPPAEGLHAKTVVLDLPGSRSMIVTGSANLTSAPWGSEVEFNAVLTGPSHSCGVKALLEGSVTLYCSR